ncbi:phage tail protein [Bradyrhizobium japonicum]|uniref:phage tail protein n=1 Tax=Bradyrhizobium japonicum TaxID=375 RepID=UPI001BAB295B|nr:phage tail protein [Bradyrhizobium japonicum]MBR0804356.1 phage tail protein [Bradyrhizobium japonicum]
MARSDPYRAFRFLVEIDNTQQGGFQSVAGLERETKTDAYREGGVNHFEHQLAGLTTYPPLTLKRGLVTTTLWDWHQDVIDGRIERKTIAVVLLDEAGNEAWRWIVSDAYPTKWTGIELDATASAIAAESVAFVHRGVTRL